MADFEPVLLRRIDKPDSPALDAYRADGGYRDVRAGPQRDDAGAGRRRRSRTPACAAAAGPGFPRGAQVDLPAQGPSRADLPVRQRRRVRALHVQQPHPDGEGPAPGARRHHPRLLRHQGHDRLLLPPLRVRRRLPRAAAGHRRVLRRRPARQEHPRQRLQPRRLHAPRGRGVHLRRGDGADREPGRQAGLAAHQAAVPGRRGGVPQADHRQQRRDAGLRHAHHRPRRRLVQVDRRAARPEEPARRRQLRPEALLHRRPRQQAGAASSCRWA